MGPKKEPEPEPFCNKCAQQHIRHNLCRNNEICDDIEELHDKKVTIKQKYLQVEPYVTHFLISLY